MCQRVCSTGRTEADRIPAGLSAVWTQRTTAAKFRDHPLCGRGNCLLGREVPRHLVCHRGVQKAGKESNCLPAAAVESQTKIPGGLVLSALRGFLIVSGYFRLWVRVWVREKIVIRIKDLIIRMPDANKLQRALVRW